MIQSFQKNYFPYAGHVGLAVAKPWWFMPKWKDGSTVDFITFRVQNFLSAQVGLPCQILGLYCKTSTPDSVTEKAVHQPGSDSQDGVWRDRRHRHWERSATGMYPLTTTIQYLRRKHNERGFGRMGEWNQRRREDGDEPEIRRRYNTARWDQGRIDRTCGKS